MIDGLLPLATFAASQVATPGAANMLLMATGARVGWRRALPFTAGVILGKQLIIWPLGFGLMNLLDSSPVVFVFFKLASAAYILFLAWRVAFMRLTVLSNTYVPGFAAGLIVHPLNPKAWAMITAIFTNFVPVGSSALSATALVATVLLSMQIIFQPLWAIAGEWMANRLAGTRAERALFVVLALLTVASVFYALFAGGFP